MIATLQHSLEWINAHPHWALALLFIAALLDSLLIIGVFVPAGVALFAGGALVALGSLELWQAVLAATLGAVLGDSFSFWLGRRYGERLFSGPLARRYPELLLNGRRFFARYGSHSIVLARFLGPMRAVVPALAGASGLGVPRFVIADVSSAAAWAFTFILPGVAFGASLGLAAEVAGRLALLLLALIGIVLLAVWLSSAVGRATQRHAEAWIGGLLDWSRRHRRLRTFGAALADPKQPETPVLALLAVILLALSGLWLWLWAGAGLRAHPSAIDAALFQSMRDLHTPWGLALAQRLLQLGEWVVYAPVALVTFACLVGLRKPRAAAHWLAAIAFGTVLSLGLYAIPTVPPPFALFGTPRPEMYIARDLVLATVIYAFLPVLLSTGRSVVLRRWFYGGTVVVLLLVLLARLYIGAQWFSTAFLAILVGAIWAGLLGLGYRRHRPEHLPARRVLIPVLLAFLISVILAWSSPKTHSFEPAAAPYRVVDEERWQAEAWHMLPAQRFDIAGRSKQTLALQWAGTLDEIAQALMGAGWSAPPPLSGSSALRWLTREAPVEELPILPQVHAGRHPVLSLRRVRDHDRAELIRFWASSLRLADGRPVWLGSVVEVEASSVYRLLRYPVARDLWLPPDEVLVEIPDLEWQRHGDIWLVSFASADDA